MLKLAIIIIIQFGLWCNIMVGFGNGKHIIIRETATGKELLYLLGAKPQAVETPLVSGKVAALKSCGFGWLIVSERAFVWMKLTWDCKARVSSRSPSLVDAHVSQSPPRP